MLRHFAVAAAMTAALFAAGGARAAATDCFGDTVDGVSSIADAGGCVEFDASPGGFFVRNWFHVSDPLESQLFEEMFVLDVNGERMDVGSLDLVDQGEADGVISFVYQLVRETFALTIGLNFGLDVVDGGIPVSLLFETVSMLLENEGDPVAVSLFTYTDFDLTGPDDDEVFPIPIGIAQIDPATGSIGGLIFSEDFIDGTIPDGFEVRDCGTPQAGECELIDAIFDGSSDSDGGVVDTEGDLTIGMRHDIAFLEDGSAEVRIVKVLAVNTAVVPEPATAALAGLGLLGLGWLRRRAA